MYVCVLALLIKGQILSIGNGKIYSPILKDLPLTTVDDNVLTYSITVSMFLVIAVVLLFKRHGTNALALPQPSLSSSPFDSSILPRSDPSDSSNGRAVLDILWSCLATTFACTWVSVHPNVPFRDEGKWTIFRRRIFLMFFSILAPEFMIMWAFKQWRGARMIREAINKAIKEASPDPRT